MMIGGEFNTPADWLRTGGAVKTIDDFAAAHGGNAPVFVFVDPAGAFNNDTECVNGSRGNAADHLTKDVVPYMVSHFGVSPDRSNWGIRLVDGRHLRCRPRGTLGNIQRFEDIAGDMGPNTGTKTQTIARLFGGDADAWAAFDPTTVITHHGPYTGLAGWFNVNGSTATLNAPITTRLLRRIRCARWALRTGSTARWSASRVSTTGRSRRTRSVQPCRGWQATSAHPMCRRRRCRLPTRQVRHLNRPPRGDHHQSWAGRFAGGCSRGTPIR